MENCGNNIINNGDDSYASSSSNYSGNIIESRKRTAADADISGSNQPLIKREATGSFKKIKENYKTIVGQLMSKITLSIDNKYLYTFRVMSDNKIKEYYGDSQCFAVLTEGKCYEMSLNFVQTEYSEWIQINEYKECEPNNSAIMPINYTLTGKEFENEDTVNTLAKFKYIYKKLNSNVYKIVFEINFQNLNDDPNIVQVECATNCRFFGNIFKRHVDYQDGDNISAIINYLKTNGNKIYTLYNVKCQRILNGSNVYYNWNMMTSTRMELCEMTADNKIAFSNLEDSENVKINISRSNKHVYSCDITNFRTEINENENGSNKFIMHFKSNDIITADNNDGMSTSSDSFSMWNRSVFYVNSAKKSETDSLQKLNADLNQAAELLEDGLIRIIIYVTVDNHDSRNMNMLSILKCSADNENCNFL
ncbi:Late expression factor 3 [Lonomia obliqua multiple nucleopolyhedrovirus]|uniref:Late expression factor 3 n=1 Tax=Lonomia obliqua multiple nucleopolyhedrovirus TaxID=134394 RepID=A0A126FCA7_9ABAC|nr:Late expression factor 3 [Lonomia obliqua multiple nucleopolyhedrovirus]AKN80985.1 Late expression factor 3 [Lonomia obliqua multiple nucleopolyhedrovirus]